MNKMISFLKTKEPNEFFKETVEQSDLFFMELMKKVLLLANWTGKQ